MIGQELDGRYKILSKLGEGAMGEVYLVRHLLLRRDEALKVLKPLLRTEGDVVSRFRREARATNRLQHPNIIMVHDFGRLPDGRFYLTTEYADGENLFNVLQRTGAMPVRRAVHLFEQLVAAADHAHARGVIHRDLKPANLILVEKRGQADVLKVLDFGVAKIIAPDYKDSVAATRDGQVFGTPMYMAPEQVHGSPPDARVDLYSIGCIAYELLTGAPPFVGKTVDVIGMHLKEAPRRVGDLARGVPDQLSAIIHRCLEKDPDDRYQTASAVAADLSEVARSLNQSSTDKQLFVSIAEDVLAAVGEATAAAESAREVGLPYAQTMHGEGVTKDEVLQSIEATSLAYRITLRQVAEALVDAGHGEFRLAIDVAQIAALEGKLGRIVAEMKELEGHGDAIEQRRREHEASLRFAIGELRFECDQARFMGRDVDPDIESQLTELEASLSRLASEIEDELGRVTDRAIDLAAQRHDAEQELDARYGELSARLDAALPPDTGNPYFANLRECVDKARAALDVATAYGS